MKKSILLGALAFFAFSALSIQDVNAQNNEVKKEPKQVVKADEKKTAPAATTTMQEPVKQKKDECCKEQKMEKKGECCKEKDLKHEDGKCVKHDGKNLKHDGKKMKVDAKKGHKHHKHAKMPDDSKMKQEQKEAGAAQN